MFQEQMAYDRNVSDDCRIAAPLATRLRDARASLSLRWLERIVARVNMEPNEVFPTQELLDHVPLLLEAMADYLENPTEEGPAADRVVAKAAELGEMRYEQGFSPYQILKEFEVLGGIVLSYLSRVADESQMECPPGEFLICAQRVHRSLALIQQATTARYLAMLEMQASEREQRLRAVNELLGGPLRQRLSETIASARDLNISDPEAWTAELRAQLDGLEGALEQVELLSSVRPSARMQRNVPLRAAVGEAIRTLRDSANDRGIAIRVPDELPEMEVNAGAVELAIMVFLTALLRHGVVREPSRSIEIHASARDASEEPVVRVTVRDQGAVFPAEMQRAFLDARAPGETISHESPPGISLSIAREAIEALGGRVSLEVEESEPRTEFVLDLPSRRATDAGASGPRRPSFGPTDA